MRSTTRDRRGDIVLVPFPFTDLTSSKKRPALVISPDSFNSRQQDLILAAITSHLAAEQDTLLIGDRDFAEGSLPKKSVVKPTKLFTIHSTLVLKKICALRRAKTTEVLNALREFFL